MRKYTRRNTNELLRLGKKNKKLRKWRRPRGRDNKMRERVKNRQKRPEIGSRKTKNEQGKVRGKTPMLIKTINDLKKIKKENIAILAKVGFKTKNKIAQEAKKLNIQFSNFDVFKFLTKQEPEKTEDKK
ncbi:MAG: hypothetical protein KKF56_01440 [Nanoarchaeota archaeon]|nr:hypothetical protein [Nanoarchaeota archaeon]